MKLWTRFWKQETIDLILQIFICFEISIILIYILAR